VDGHGGRHETITAFLFLPGVMDCTKNDMQLPAPMAELS
jgi:hypothetical protein